MTAFWIWWIASTAILIGSVDEFEHWVEVAFG